MMGDVISANKVLVSLSGLANCLQSMVMGRQFQAGEETYSFRVRGKMWVSLAVRLKSSSLCWSPCLDAPRSTVWVCSLK